MSVKPMVEEVPETPTKIKDEFKQIKKDDVNVIDLLTQLLKQQMEMQKHQQDQISSIYQGQAGIGSGHAGRQHVIDINKLNNINKQEAEQAKLEKALKINIERCGGEQHENIWSWLSGIENLKIMLGWSDRIAIAVAGKNMKVIGIIKQVIKVLIGSILKKILQAVLLYV
jgi:hypothetical protein